MNEQKLHLYSIMPLDTDHLEAVCQDILAQYQQGVATCPLFCMTLVPEGNPPADKAALLSGKYKQFRSRLRELGVPSGVLVQATIGHGWRLSEMFPFQRYTSFNSGEETNTACPFDPGFRDYIFNALKTVAAAGPDTIMIDDDFRLIARKGRGCACPLHMRRFRELSGTELSREALWEIVSDESHEKCLEYTEYMVQAQRESIVETARVMRAGIDAVDPALPGSFCCVGHNAEFAGEVAQILAGKGNPVIIRINNGNYLTASPRSVCNSFRRAASQIAKLRGTADILLAETDTCPQNRYSTGAMPLHTHFTGSLLEGAAGAKQWITRLHAFEPESGKAYRRVLGSHRGFYEALAALVPALRWRGCRIPVCDKPYFRFGSAYDRIAAGFGWASCVLERLGIPHYYSADPGGVVCLEGAAVIDRMEDGALLDILRGPVFLASDAAERLIARGLGRYLGADVRPWTGKAPTNERLFINDNTTNLQVGLRELVPNAPGVIEDSEVFHSVDKVHRERLFPGTTIYKNELGGTVFLFCGTPQAEFNLVEAFAFLNWSRKQQLLRMLAGTGELPVYCPGDEEVYLRAADMPDGGLFCGVFNIGMDPIETTELVCARAVTRIEKLLPDGSRAAVPFRRDGDRYILDTASPVLDPTILFLY